MSYAKTINQFSSVIAGVVKWVQMVGLVFLALMMFLTATDVIMRYVFNRPIIGSLELTEAWMVILISFSIGYTALLKEHVIVDLFILRLPPRGRDVAACVATFITFVFFAMIAWRSLIQTMISYKARTESSALYLPEWVFIAFVVFGFALLALVLLLQFLQYLGKLIGKWTQ